MTSLAGSIQNQFNAAYDWVEGTGVAVKQEVSNKVQRAKISVMNAGQACVDTADKVKAFLYENREAIFFTGCSLTTAYFAPHLFFPSFIITIAARIEFSRTVKEYMERNGYKLINPKFESYFNTVDVALGTLAALDAVALGTIFLTNSWTVYLIPAMGGVLAGNTVAKYVMNYTNLLADPEQSPVAA